jgi:hypothetical protein
MNYQFNNYLRQTNQIEILNKIPNKYAAIVKMTFQNYFYNNFRLLCFNKDKTDNQSTTLFNKELRRISYEQANIDTNEFIFSFSYTLFKKIQFKLTSTIKDGVIYSEIFMTKHFFIEKCCRHNIDMMIISKLIKSITSDNFNCFTMNLKESVPNLDMYAPAPVENLDCYFEIADTIYPVSEKIRINSLSLHKKYHYVDSDLSSIFYSGQFDNYFFYISYDNIKNIYSQFFGKPMGHYSINVSNQIIELINELNISILDLDESHFDLVKMIEY